MCAGAMRRSRTEGEGLGQSEEEAEHPAQRDEHPLVLLEAPARRGPGRVRAPVSPTQPGPCFVSPAWFRQLGPVGLDARLAAGAFSARPRCSHCDWVLCARPGALACVRMCGARRYGSPC